jgi:predicted nucleotidyltransferase
MLLQRLKTLQLITPPEWLVYNTQYLTIMGSQAYGVSTDASDDDIYGFAIPLKEDVFPHLKGEIEGFGKNKQRFETWQQHHVEDKESRKQYDFQVYSIVRYFSLCMDNNPNMIDSLFTPVNCVIHSTQVAEMIREHRKMFLHKGSWHKFKGYAYSQMHKMDIKVPEGKRKESIEEHGYDLKFAYHVVRLLNEVEQILIEGDLDLQRNREQLKAIRRGDWTKEQIHQYFTDKEKILEETYAKSTIPYGPDEGKIKELLLKCLEHHYGNLDKVIVIPGRLEEALRQISEICKKVYPQ